jgi:hypothetical protein
MSQLEEKIRDTLSSEAARLRAVRPLTLPTAIVPGELRSVPGPRRARRLRAWLGPVAAAAAVVLVAATLVTLKSLGSGRTAAPAASPSPIAGPGLAADAVPRYYVQLGSGGPSVGPAIVVGDEQARKTIATFPLLPKRSGGPEVLPDLSVAGAADDRTFVVSAAIRSMGGQVVLPLTWYLVRILPNAAGPVRVTRLPVEFSTDSTANSLWGWRVVTTALSGDGTELAVVSADYTATSKGGGPVRLQVYSVATGRLQHSWSAGIDETQGNLKPITDLSWVGDRTVGFAVTYTPAVREEVRALDVSAPGASLLAASRVVWSQYVPPSRLTAREKATITAIEPPPHACDTPFLTGDGQAVVCGNATYSAADKRLTAVWLAYPLATPTRARVLGRVQEPPSVSAFAGSIGVEWTNPAGTEVIGAWNATVITGPTDNPVSTTTNYMAYIGNGTVKTFPFILGGMNLAW